MKLTEEGKRQFEEFKKTHPMPSVGEPYPVPVNRLFDDDRMNLMNYVLMLCEFIDCEGCDAPCCRGVGMDNLRVALLDDEYTLMIELSGYSEKELMRIGAVKKKANGRWKDKFLMLPCIFLKEGKCGIYEERPQTCRTYPFGQMMREEKFGISSNCPQYNEAMYQAWWIYDAIDKIGCGIDIQRTEEMSDWFKRRRLSELKDNHAFGVPK